MKYLRLLPICMVVAACAAGRSEPGTVDAISGQYRVVFDASIRQVDGGRTEVLARDTALLTLDVQGDVVTGTWRTIGAGDAQAEIPLRGSLDVDGVMRVRGPEASNTVVSRECTVDEEGNEACRSSERQVTLTPLYTLSVNGAAIEGTLVYVQQGAAPGQPFSIEGRRTSAPRTR